MNWGKKRSEMEGKKNLGKQKRGWDKEEKKKMRREIGLKSTAVALKKIVIQEKYLKEKSFVWTHADSGRYSSGTQLNILSKYSIF